MSNRLNKKSIQMETFVFKKKENALMDIFSKVFWSCNTPINQQREQKLTYSYLDG